MLFVEMCCKAANLDLTEFFEKWGFLRPINRMIKDYGNKDMIITQSQIDATKAKIAAAGYPAPPHTADQIITIRDTNVAQFRQ